MSLFAPIDIYCERLTAELLAEPLNALSNISFFIAAYFLFLNYKKNNLESKPIIFLVALILKIGIGSLFFHTFANHITMLADVIPIMIFVFAYLFIALKMLLNFSNIQTYSALFLMLLASVATSSLPPALSFNGSASYFPCLVALLLIAWRSKNKLLYCASLTFFFSLTFRSIDMLVCEKLAVGTHFLWHLLNGLLLYLLIKTLINHCVASKRM